MVASTGASALECLDLLGRGEGDRAAFVLAVALGLLGIRHDVLDLGLAGRIRGLAHRFLLSGVRASKLDWLMNSITPSDRASRCR